MADSVVSTLLGIILDWIKNLFTSKEEKQAQRIQAIVDEDRIRQKAEAVHLAEVKTALGDAKKQNQKDLNQPIDPKKRDFFEDINEK